jgi:hypothetical protein
VVQIWNTADDDQSGTAAARKSEEADLVRIDPGLVGSAADHVVDQPLDVSGAFEHDRQIACAAQVGSRVAAACRRAADNPSRPAK